MTDSEISVLYDLIKEFHEKYLKCHGVQLPNLKRGDSFTKDALVLVYLAKGYPNTAVVSKEELTEFVRLYYPNTNDVQQARHLAGTKGFYILSGTRKDFASFELKPGEYKLKTLETYYPGFSNLRRDYQEGDNFFEALKKDYDYRCATCGSKEGELHRYRKNVITSLQKGHMNPNKPLKAGNIIPQCEFCNRPDRNYWIYDKNGRVVGIANEIVVDKCTPDLKEKIYLRLKRELGK